MLSSYIDHHAQLLHDIHAHFSCSKAAANNLIIMLYDGGMIIFWYREHGVNTSITTPTYITSVEREMADLRKHLTDLPEYEAIRKHCASKKTDPSTSQHSTLANNMSRHEAKKLDAMVASAKSQGCHCKGLVFDGTPSTRLLKLICTR